MQVAISSTDLISSLVLLLSSDSNDIQVASAHCLARFAAWQGVAKQTLCTGANAEVVGRHSLAQ